MVVFGGSVANRAAETGTPERTMYRRIKRFEKDGMESLFATDPAAARARRRGLEPCIRRMIVELKAEHPKFNANEIANIIYVRTGRHLGRHTAGRILAVEVVPLKLSLHAALEQKRGAEVSVRIVGRVMAVHRELYGLTKPKRSPGEKAEMPFRASKRHEIWTAEVRYVPHSIPETGNAYVIAVLEKYSRCVLASAVSLTQNTTAFLRVFYLDAL